MATPPKKPTTRKPATRKPAAKASGAAGAVTGDAKTAPSKPATPRKPAARKAPAAQTKAAVKSAPHNTAEKAKAAVKRTKDKSPVGFKTAIAAGIGAIGAVATAALLTLRGSTPKQDSARPPAPKDSAKAGHAEQADGTDSSKSFEAGIADEGSVPHA